MVNLIAWIFFGMNILPLEVSMLRLFWHSHRSVSSDSWHLSSAAAVLTQVPLLIVFVFRNPDSKPRFSFLQPQLSLSPYFSIVLVFPCYFSLSLLVLASWKNLSLHITSILRFPTLLVTQSSHLSEAEPVGQVKEALDPMQMSHGD